MEKIEVYNPFNMDSEFHIITDNNKRYFKIENLLLEISENGYIPKSGLLFYDVLNEKNIANKSILDLGCGFLGILGIISMLRGAKTIEAVDYDLNCVYWFNKLIKDNNFNIDCYQSDYFKNVDNKKYDIILSNPPQMPMISGSVHDSGGIDGRKYILKIMEEARAHLNDDGSLYILIFDFLGIENGVDFLVLHQAVGVDARPGDVESAAHKGRHGRDIVADLVFEVIGDLGDDRGVHAVKRPPQ